MEQDDGRGLVSTVTVATTTPLSRIESNVFGRLYSRLDYLVVGFLNAEATLRTWREYFT
jgi:hypothetical protein